MVILVTPHTQLLENQLSGLCWLCWLCWDNGAVTPLHPREVCSLVISSKTGVLPDRFGGSCSIVDAASGSTASIKGVTPTYRFQVKTLNVPIIGDQWLGK